MHNLKPFCLCLAILGLLCFSSAQAPESDPWADWKFLLGEWTVGQGGGVPGTATSGSFSLRPELGGKILLRKNHSEYAVAAGKPPVVHDDLMVIYREAGVTKAFYDDSEGHVIHYNVSISADKKQIIFLSDQVAAQPRYRLTYQNLGQDSVSVVFEIAPPNKPGQFSKYVEGTVHRRFTSNP